LKFAKIFPWYLLFGHLLRNKAAVLKLESELFNFVGAKKAN
jgi:hypothetical protein